MTKTGKYTEFDKGFVKTHALDTLGFYVPQCVDEQNGGFYQTFLKDGTVCDDTKKDLIGTARFIVDFSLVSLMTGSNNYDSFIEHGLEFLLEVHEDKKYGGFFQTVTGKIPVKDEDKRAYSHAFALLAFSRAFEAGFEKAESYITSVFELMEETFWEERFGLYATQVSRDLTSLSSYRGQNANMHMVEGLIAAYEATGEEKYIKRAMKVARRIAVELANECGGLIWEHYTSSWDVDPDYNKDDPENIYRPFGFLPGHLLEWSKLLLILERYEQEDWLKEKSVELYRKAIEHGWDKERKGFNYTFDFERNVLNQDRYYWVHAEAVAVSFLLWARTGNKKYLNWYEEFWNYSLDNLVDNENGGWYRVVDQEGKPFEEKKSIPGKTDYHTINACYDIYKTCNKIIEN